jgi:class 3 adenylate cyclase
MRRAKLGEVVTVLFTDIVGSTEVASELGDAGWAALAARHHAAVRADLKRFQGREMDTAGDGFFAAFSRPAEAIRCACAIADKVHELGIEIRAGIHVGEVEHVDGKVGGIAVNVGARIMSLGPWGTSWSRPRFATSSQARRSGWRMAASTP